MNGSPYQPVGRMVARRFMLLTILAFSILITSSPHALGAAFEGVVHFKSNYWGNQSEFDYYSKGNKTRMETRRSRHGRAAVIMDLEARKVSMLLLNWRLAMVMNMEETSLPAANRPSGSLTKTGKTKTLIGYRADQFLHSGQEEDTEVWGTTGLGVLFIGLHTRGPGFGRTGDSPDWVRALRDQNIFPLIVIRKNKAGEEQARMEATDIERKEISDELFVVPPKYITYNKFAPDNTMPGMPGTVWIK